MRSPVSTADLNLLSFLSDHGHVVSRYRLERWRTEGLLPRAIVERHQFGGSVVPNHPESVYEAALLLAEVLRPGRRRAYAAILLVRDGYWVRESTLREAFEFFTVGPLTLQLLGDMDSNVSVGAETPHEALLDASYASAERLMRSRRFATQRRALQAHALSSFPPVSKEDVQERITQTLALRLADLANPGSLSPDEELIARFELLQADESERAPLLSELVACARTITLAESILVAVNLDLDPDLQIGDIALNILLALTTERREESGSVTTPLSRAFQRDLLTWASEEPTVDA